MFKKLFGIVKLVNPSASDTITCTQPSVESDPNNCTAEEPPSLESSTGDIHLSQLIEHECEETTKLTKLCAAHILTASAVDKLKLPEPPAKPPLQKHSASATALVKKERQSENETTVPKPPELKIVKKKRLSNFIQQAHNLIRKDGSSRNLLHSEASKSQRKTMLILESGLVEPKERRRKAEALEA